MTDSQNFHIAIIGPESATSGFRALGFTRISVSNSDEAREAILDLRSKTQPNGKPQFAIIFLLEELASKITEDDWKKWSTKALPAVTLLPGLKQSGLAASRMKKIVERAIGSDILG